MAVQPPAVLMGVEAVVSWIFSCVAVLWAARAALETMMISADKDAGDELARRTMAVRREHARLRRRFFTTCHEWARMAATRGDAEEALQQLEAFEAEHDLKPVDWARAGDVARGTLMEVRA